MFKHGKIETVENKKDDGKVPKALEQKNNSPKKVGELEDDIHNGIFDESKRQKDNLREVDYLLGTEIALHEHHESVSSEKLSKSGSQQTIFG